jgi:hypothetical protein
MEDALERLQAQLLLLYRRALTRVYFFAQVAKAYETVLYRPFDVRLQPVRAKVAIEKKAALKRQQETSELDERLEAALQKAAKVWKGKEPKMTKPTAPRGVPAATEPQQPAAKPAFSRILIQFDSEAFHRLMSKKKAWRHRRSQLQNRISKANEASLQAQSSFLTRLSSLHSSHSPTLVAQAIAEQQLATEIHHIVMDADIQRALGTMAQRNKEDWTLEDWMQLATVYELGEWLETQINELRTVQAFRKVEEIREIWREMRVNQGRRLSVEPQHTLLTRLKGLRVSGDIGKLVGCYTAWALFRLQQEVFTSAESLPSTSSLETLRLLHCLVVKNGAILLTVSLA